MEKEKDIYESDSVEGAVERITYQNKENGYTVCVVSYENEKGKPENLTLVGIMPYLSVGETVKAVGSWGFHPTFGRQFNVEYFEKQLPTTESAMLRYLSSKTVKGVGPKIAARIILELKDKIAKEAEMELPVSDSSPVSSAPLPKGNKLTEARTALMALGFTRGEAEGFLRSVDCTKLSVEEIIREALKKV